MATVVQIRRGNTAKIAAYAGPVGEIIFNTDTGRIHVQDSVTLGGIPFALVSDLSGGGGGNGDMTKAVYDPTDRQKDVFDMASMVEATDAKVMKAAERTKLAAIANNATNNSTDAYLLDLANATGNLAQSRVNNLTADLASKLPATARNTAGGVAGLDGDGKISKSQLPALAITDTFVVNSEAEMLALSTAETGDIAIRTDLHTTFILTADPYDVLANWAELLAPLAGVTSVAGESGVVTASALLLALNLDKVNNTSDANKPISTATQAALDEKWGATTTSIDYGNL